MKTLGGELNYFRLLNRDEQHRAIRKLADIGISEHVIASATRLAVEQIRRVLAERVPA